ncbi:DUF397 domain-containing protein [Streptomyces alfalfae]|uniref:DUF397 domain-containing protein n=1 Tax=Streptomyces alfalfae TaxID=1642299 RepID=A0A7T4PG05_9ACTN|nr:DUF397 domain-containing protein [Streptomyces alfalfae]QQC89482.1 DUF397 domain-containing protein [Streptomyces alfalfae]
MDPRRPLRWFKSSYSGGSGTECVEVAVVMPKVLVRDTKCPGGGRVSVGVAAWAEFVTALPATTRR